METFLAPVHVMHYMLLATVLFTIGFVGVFLNRRHVIGMLMSLELVLLAVNINLVAVSTAYGEVSGQVFSFFILTVAAAEAAIGLAILVVYFRAKGRVDIDAMQELRG